MPILKMKNTKRCFWGGAWVCMLCIAMAMFTSSCSHSDEEPTIAHRTVCAYMISESLDEPILNNVRMMKSGSVGISDNDNLIVYLDRPNLKSMLLRISNGAIDTLMTYKTNNISVDPSVVRDAIAWSFEHYPAESYGVIFASHGSGWLVRGDTVAVAKTPKSSYGYDKGGMSINIPSLKMALSGLPKLDFILWDCCNMQCIEVAYELRNTTDCLMGSPSEIPSAGGPYNKLVPAMFSHAANYRETTLKEYWNYYARDRGDSLPLSLIYTKDLEQFANVTHQKLQMFMPQNPLRIDLSNLIFYLRDTKRNNDRVMFDMNNFMLVHLAKGDVTNADYIDWKRSLDNVVTLKYRCTRWKTNTMRQNDFMSFYKYLSNDDHYSGISMYVPSSDYIASHWNYNYDLHSTEWYYAVNWGDFGW